MLNVHRSLFHLEVYIHSVEALFSHHKDAVVGLETAIEFLDDCRVEGALVQVQGGHLEWKWEWKNAQYANDMDILYIQYIDVCI